MQSRNFISFSSALQLEMILLLCFLALLAPAFSQGYTCDEGWTLNTKNASWLSVKKPFFDSLPYDDEKCYMLLTGKKMDFDAAKSACEGLNATIAIASTPYDNHFLFELLLYILHTTEKSKTAITNIWLGATPTYFYHGRYRKWWYWIDDSEWGDWLNWENNAPNYGGGNEECLMMHGYNGKWNDVRCYLKKHAVCQKPSNRESLG